MERKVVTGGLPIGWNVQMSIKERIWADKYIEFGDLLESDGDTEYGAKLDPKDNSTVWFSKSKRVVKTLKDWDRAFTIYFNIYLQRPHNWKHLPHLVTYWSEMKKVGR